jgi:hypothetical protein
MASSIERLPVEIFEIIASDLDLSAFEHLRLSSRQLHLLSLSIFAKQHFSELTTTLGSASLDRLVQISNHAYLSSTVALLDITLLTQFHYKHLKKICNVGIFPPPKRFSRVSGVKPAHIRADSTLYDDVFSHRFPKCIVDPLACCLLGFSNLKAVRFRTHHNEYPGSASMRVQEDNQTFRSKCYQAVFDAIFKSDIQLQDFSMAKEKGMSSLSKHANLPYSTVQPQLRNLQSLQHCLQHLQSLTLSVITAHNENHRVPGWENGLGQLIVCAPNLKNLALSLDRKSRVSHYSAAVMHSLASSCQLELLQTFRLVNSSLHESDVLAFVAAHAKTLHQLVFRDIQLLTGSWISVWISLKEVRGLRCIRLDCLWETESPIVFRKRNKERLKVVLDVGKAGRPMSAMLDEIITAYKMDNELSMTGFDVE